MDPFKVLEQIKNFQSTGDDYTEWVKNENLNENRDFIHCLLFLLTADSDISDSQKLLVICFMKRYNIYFKDQEDINSILPFLENDNLKCMTSQLIVAHYDGYNDLFDLMQSISDQYPSFYLQLLSAYIEKCEFDENSYECVQETVNKLKSYVENSDLDIGLRLESVKNIISFYRSIKNEEIEEIITKDLLTIYIECPIEIENKPIFYEILRLRSSIEKLKQIEFYQKTQELANVFSQQGPSLGVDDSSFFYYLSEIIFHIFEFFGESIGEILTLTPDHLVSILFLFSVYHKDEVESWLEDVEEFFSSNSDYLLLNRKFLDEESEEISCEELNENFVYKESFELHQFIYSEFIRLGSFEFDERTNLLSLATQTISSMIGSEIPNYSTTCINLSSILFFYKLDPVVKFDINKYTETSDDISIIYFILYCSKKEIEFANISDKIEYFLSQEPEMFSLLIASILVNYNTESINPDLYSSCFVKCLETISSFFTEKVTGIMNLLFLLADFENKPAIVPGFTNEMGKIMDFLVSNLVLFQNAYQSTASMCNLIAHFIRYIGFQENLLPSFLNFINQLCSSVFYANLGIRLENAILNCKSSRSSFNEKQINEFHQIFTNHLSYFDFDYLIENPSIIPPILTISNFFAKKSLINDIEERIFCIFSQLKIPSLYFDKISPLLISFIKNENSSHKFEMLKLMIKRSDLFNTENDDNPLLYPTIVVLAHLGIDNPEHFELLMREFDFNFIDILTAINCRFKANLDVMDDRLILVMLSNFGSFQVYTDDLETAENLSVLNQTNSLKFFQKVVSLIQEGKVEDLQKSLFFDSEDDVFNTELMSCPLSKLLDVLISDPSDYSIIQSKAEFLSILEENGL